MGFTAKSRHPHEPAGSTAIAVACSIVGLSGLVLPWPWLLSCHHVTGKQEKMGQNPIEFP